MRKIWLLIGIALLVSALSVGAAACDDDEDTAGAEAQLCQDLAQLEVAVSALADISLDSTVDDLRAANAAVDDALDDVSKSADKVAEARVSDLGAAYDDLDRAIRDIPSGATLQEALASIEEGLAAVDAAWLQLFSSLGC